MMRLPDMREAGDISGSKVLARGAVPPTYIPMKNAVYYSLAAAFADEKGSSVIMGGHNSDDSRLFDDTSEKFFAALEAALRAGSPRLRNSGLKLVRPLKEMSKAEVIATAAKLRVPLELTWSCHRAGEEHCWRCEGCRARVDAFRAAGVEDPLRPQRKLG